MVTSHCVSPSRPSPIGIECVPERIENRPVMRADRLGVHCASTLKLVSRIPSVASLSMRGVGAPRTTPPPYTPTSPYPRLSIRMKRMLGFFSAARDGARDADSTAPATMMGSHLIRHPSPDSGSHFGADAHHRRSGPTAGS